LPALEGVASVSRIVATAEPAPIAQTTMRLLIRAPARDVVRLGRRFVDLRRVAVWGVVPQDIAALLENLWRPLLPQPLRVGDGGRVRVDETASARLARLGSRRTTAATGVSDEAYLVRWRSRPRRRLSGPDPLASRCGTIITVRESFHSRPR